MASFPDLRMKEQLREAFLSGFFVSREGFNGECAFAHLTPESVSRISSSDIEELEVLADRYLALVLEAEENIG